MPASASPLIQRYVEAAHVLGHDPPVDHRLVKAAKHTHVTIDDIGIEMDQSELMKW